MSSPNIDLDMNWADADIDLALVDFNEFGASAKDEFGLTDEDDLFGPPVEADALLDIDDLPEIADPEPAPKPASEIPMPSIPLPPQTLPLSQYDAFTTEPTLPAMAAADQVDQGPSLFGLDNSALLLDYLEYLPRPQAPSYGTLRSMTLQPQPMAPVYSQQHNHVAPQQQWQALPQMPPIPRRSDLEEPSKPRPPPGAKISHRRAKSKEFSIDSFAWYEEVPSQTSYGNIHYRMDKGRTTGELAFEPEMKPFTKATFLEYLATRRTKSLTLWVQHTPTQHNHRFWHQYASHKCRMKDCPRRGTIHRGDFQVALDENPALTGDHYDPFKIAGYVHLFCLERVIHMPWLMATHNVQPDTRIFQKEDKNPMSLNRDGPGHELESNYHEWRHVFCRDGELRHLRDPPREPPRTFFNFDKDLLSNWLTIGHVDQQSAARQHSRNKRDGFDISKHLGNLEKAVEGKAKATAKNRRRRERAAALIPLSGSSTGSSHGGSPSRTYQQLGYVLPPQRMGHAPLFLPGPPAHLPLYAQALAAPLQHQLYNSAVGHDLRDTPARRASVVGRRTSEFSGVVLTESQREVAGMMEATGPVTRSRSRQLSLAGLPTEVVASLKRRRSSTVRNRDDLRTMVLRSAHNRRGSGAKVREMDGLRKAALRQIGDGLVGGREGERLLDELRKETVEELRDVLAEEVAKKRRKVFSL